MKQFTLWQKQFTKYHGRNPTNEESWNAAIQLISEARPTVRAKRPVQQAKEAITPADYEFCPHCHGSFSFAKLGINFRCKWCKKDVRTSGRLA